MNFTEFNNKFATEKDCIDYFIKIRYGNKISCNHCGCIDNIYRLSKFNKVFHCNHCNNDFSVFKGTIFEKSNTDLRKWLYAIHLFLSSKKGVSGYQLQREINVTYKCAWRILKKIREAMNDDNDDNEHGNMLCSLVKIDKYCIEGKTESKHMNKCVKAKGIFNKPYTLGTIKKFGKVKAFHINNNAYLVLGKKILDNVNDEATIYTDERKSYALSRNFYTHKTINCSKGKYVDNDIYTNAIEGFWVALKVGINRIYHYVSNKYLQGYIDKFDFRYNNRNNKAIADRLLKGCALN